MDRECDCGSAYDDNNRARIPDNELHLWPEMGDGTASVLLHCGRYFLQPERYSIDWRAQCDWQVAPDFSCERYVDGCDLGVWRSIDDQVRPDRIWYCHHAGASHQPRPLLASLG